MAYGDKNATFYNRFLNLMVEAYRELGDTDEFRNLEDKIRDEIRTSRVNRTRDKNAALRKGQHEHQEPQGKPKVNTGFQVIRREG